MTAKRPLRITLIGFSGTGKSAVARLVAARLRWSAVDTDAEIERQAGKSIERIFAEEGELAFRRREATFVQSLEKRQRLVVAAGGGATLLETSRRSIAARGLVVCLEATPATILVRLHATGDASERPLLAGGDPSTRIEWLKAQRAAVYDLADFTVATDVLSPEEVADEVVRLFQAYGERTWERPGRLSNLTRTPSVLPPVLDAPGATTIVRTASADYPAYVGWGELDRLGEHVRRATGARRAFLISDERVLAQWGEAALSSLRGAGLETFQAAVPPGDASKSLASTGKLYSWLAEHRAERRDAVVAFGGGMVGDLAGFVAATYLRGLPLVQVPTTLLGMVDASIGGKTAVNHAGAKNMVGAFYQPRAVVADVATLKTLPRRELVEGLGEVIKHAFLFDEGLVEILEKRLDELLALDPELTVEVLRRNILLKAAVVSEDERETGGKRELLNYGHTLGHAFEAAGEYQKLLHGEAVAVGMTAATAIGERVGITPPELARRQRRLIERAGLPTTAPRGLDPGRVRDALAMDKKIVRGTQRWVLLEAIGRPVVREDISAAVVSQVLDELLT